MANHSIGNLTLSLEILNLKAASMNSTANYLAGDPTLSLEILNLNLKVI